MTASPLPPPPSDSRLTVLTVYGTRPEAIKLAPLVLALDRHPRTRVNVVLTGQHREMLDQVNEAFGLRSAADLDICEPGQTLTDVTTRTLTGLAPLIDRLRPDLVLVQGDTTSTFAAALAAFYAKIPVVHAEAGLRTDDRYSPYPEEINRRLTTQLATLHLAPTALARSNLERDGVAPDSIVVTGNSVIDALLATVARPLAPASDELARRLALGRPVILATTHRRESWGAPMRQIGHALRELALTFPDHDLVVPLHRNPLVRQALVPPLEDLPNAVLVEPVPYDRFCHLMARARLILTDSGGIQEEGPSLGKPVLVLRDNTERPEAVLAGTVRLVGTQADLVVAAATELLTNPVAYATMAAAVNPYGDGRAAERTVTAILHRFRGGRAPDEFDPVDSGRAPNSDRSAVR